jgi:hypothetical protein
MIGFIVVTDETALELVIRLRDATKDLYSVEEIHALAAPKPEDIACASAGLFGPLNHWTRVGLVEARKLNQSKNVRQHQRRKMILPERPK